MNTLRDRLTRPGIVLAPGVYDALSAVLVEQAGFEAAYLSGASIAYTRIARPDIGLVGMTEVRDTLSAIRERTDLPPIVDADTGYGNALNAASSVATFERAGASAIQLEDQTLPKRCGHLSGKTLVAAEEMIGKIMAAVDARRDRGTLIVARTDAIAVEGFAAAIERAERYLEAGADILFVEAPRTRDEMADVTRRFGARIPVLANMVEGGKTPLLSAQELDELGFKIAIFPGGTVRAVARHLQEYIASLKQHGTTRPFAARMLDFDGINRLIGTAETLARSERYDPAHFEKRRD